MVMKRRYARRDPYKKKYRSPKSNPLAKKVNRLVKSIETKHIDSYNTTSVSTASTFILLNPIGQGDDVVNRIGNVANMKNLSYKYGFLVGDSANYVRCMLVQDLQPIGSQPALSDVLQDTSTANNVIFSPIRWDNRRRFKVLRDHVELLDTNDPYGKYPSGFKGYVRLNFKTQYNGAGSSIAQINKNSLWLILVSDSGAATHPLVNTYVRLTFTDF